jgi:hypothetical protein
VALPTGTGALDGRPCRFGTVPAPAGYGLWRWMWTVRYWMTSWCRPRRGKHMYSMHRHRQRPPPWRLPDMLLRSSLKHCRNVISIHRL